MERDHLPYSQSVMIERHPRRLFTKRDWVPLWLWRLVSEADLVSHIEVSWRESQALYEEELKRMLSDAGHAGL
jgi:hypothetical protein